MAELVLSPLLQLVLDKLASPLLEKLYDLFYLRGNIKKLQELLPTVQAFLEDAQKRQLTDKAVEIWVRKLKSIAYETEDLLDEIAVEKIMCEPRSGRRKELSTLIVPFDPSRHFLPLQPSKYLMPFKQSRNFFDLADKLPNKLKEFDKIVNELDLICKLRLWRDMLMVWCNEKKRDRVICY